MAEVMLTVAQKNAVAKLLGVSPDEAERYADNVGGKKDPRDAMGFDLNKDGLLLQMHNVYGTGKFSIQAHVPTPEERQEIERAYKDKDILVMRGEVWIEGRQQPFVDYGIITKGKDSFMWSSDNQLPAASSNATRRAMEMALASGLVGCPVGRGDSGDGKVFVVDTTAMPLSFPPKQGAQNSAPVPEPPKSEPEQAKSGRNPHYNDGLRKLLSDTLKSPEFEKDRQGWVTRAASVKSEKEAQKFVEDAVRVLAKRKKDPPPQDRPQEVTSSNPECKATQEQLDWAALLVDGIKDTEKAKALFDLINGAVSVEDADKTLKEMKALIDDQNKDVDA